MKLSTRSRYGTRLMLDLAQHYNKGPVQISEIAMRQNISVKYLEQLIIPLKKAGYITSIRGPKGGHMIARPPEKIRIGEIVKLLEKKTGMSPCVEDPERCNRTDTCLTHDIWEMATSAAYDKLNTFTLSDVILKRQGV